MSERTSVLYKAPTGEFVVDRLDLSRAEEETAAIGGILRTAFSQTYAGN